MSASISPVSSLVSAEESNGYVVIFSTCDSCGRKFSEDVLSRHTAVCNRLKNRRRKVFNSGAQRANGSDIPIDKVLKPGEIPRPDSKLQIALLKKKNWRRKHLDLLNTIKCVRGKQYVNSSNYGSQTSKELPADYKVCNFCKRRFQEDVALRHIPFCKDIHQRMAYKEKLKHSKTSARLTNKVLDTQEYVYQKQRPLSPQQSLLDIQRTDCVNNSSLVVQSTQSRPLRTGRSQCDYTKARKELGCLSAGSRIPSNPSTDENHAISPISVTNKSVLSTEKSLKHSPDSYKNLSFDSPSDDLKVESRKTARFCFHCGSKYVLDMAKYCSNCGTLRLIVDKVRK